MSGREGFQEYGQRMQGLGGGMGPVAKEARAIDSEDGARWRPHSQDLQPKPLLTKKKVSARCCSQLNT